MQEHSTRRLSPQERADKLTDALEQWRFQGYQVMARQPTSAQLVKHKGSPLGLVVIALLLSVVLIPFTNLFVGIVVFVLSLVLIAAYQVGRRDKLAQITVDPDGTIYQE